MLKPELSRRSLLKTGFIGTAVLAGASTVSVLTGCSSKPARYPMNESEHAVYQFLNKEDVTMVAALIPVIAGDTWPDEAAQQRAAIDQTLPRVDRFLSRLGDFNRSEIRQLFDLLHMRVARGLTAGVWSDWESASPEDLNDFLLSWKHSSIALFNNAHAAFTDVIGFAWYSNPQVSGSLGYSGITDTVRQALPQFQSS